MTTAVMATVVMMTDGNNDGGGDGSGDGDSGDDD
jgi:hypothetical protein